MSRRRADIEEDESAHRCETMTAVVLGGLLYFVAVFALGFALGIPRTLWLEPVLGERWAELVELPIMLLWIYFAARWIARRPSLAARPMAAGAGVGMVALLLLIGAEIVVVLELRQIGLAEYVATRDAVSGTAYAVSLVLFAVMPALVRGRDADVVEDDDEAQ